MRSTKNDDGKTFDGEVEGMLNAVNDVYFYSTRRCSNRKKIIDAFN